MKVLNVFVLLCVLIQLDKFYAQDKNGVVVSGDIDSIELRSLQNSFKKGIEYRSSSLDYSLEYLKSTLENAILFDNIEFIYQSYRAIGETYFLLSDFDSALHNYRKALEVIDKEKDLSYYSYILINFGEVYYKQGNYTETLKCYKLAQTNGMFINDDYLLSLLYLRFAELYLEIDLFNDAELYIELGKSSSNSLNNPMIKSWLLYNQAKLFARNNKLDQAIAMFNYLLNNNKLEGTDYLDYQISCSIELADCLYENKNYKQAFSSLQNISNLFNDERTIFNRKRVMFYLSLGKILTQLGRYDKAEYYLNLGVKTSSDFDRPLITKMCYEELYVLSKSQNKNEKALAYLEKSLHYLVDNNKDLSSLIVSIKTSDNLREEYINLEKEKSTLEYKEKEFKKEAKLSILIRNLLIGLFAFLIFLISLIYYINSIKKDRRIIQFRLRALRSQMNPHFVFNTLTGIQNYILKEDKITAYTQLVRFSKLIRYILNENSEDYITLDKELNFVKDYLELEKMRFLDRLNYSIQIDEEIELQSIIIPSLMLQPIIENAIIHGISNKREGGSLQLKITKSMSKVIISVTDDGIGRRNAKMIKQEENPRNSVSTSNLDNRLKIFNKTTNKRINVSINDLENHQGTKVIFEIHYPQQC